jgi:hypothetical protein
LPVRDLVRHQLFFQRYYAFFPSFIALLRHEQPPLVCLAAGPLSAKLLKNGTLKTYKDFPHGMITTQADVINADLLRFIES